MRTAVRLCGAPMINSLTAPSEAMIVVTAWFALILGDAVPSRQNISLEHTRSPAPNNSLFLRLPEQPAKS
jgi:hypothetical protein